MLFETDAAATLLRQGDYVLAPLIVFYDAPMNGWLAILFMWSCVLIGFSYASFAKRCAPCLSSLSLLPTINEFWTQIPHRRSQVYLPAHPSEGLGL